MKNIFITLIALLGFIQLGSAQVGLGTISGKTFDDDSTTIVPGAKVWIEVGASKRGTASDFDGKFKIDGLQPGVYTLHAESVLKGEVVISDIKVNADGITTVDVIMDNPNMFEPIVIVHNPLKIEKDIPKINLLAEDIDHSPNRRNPLAMINNSTTDIKVMEGTDDIIVRGSRPGDVAYFIDGVKVQSLSGVPGAALGGLEAYTGGIPAKYGDTMGGVVAVQTKGYFDLYYSWLATQSK